MSRHRRAAWAVTVLMSMILAACGGSSADPSDAGDDPASVTTGGADGGNGSASPASAGSEDADTFAEIFGYNDDPAANEAEYRQTEADREESIRQCMAEQGFEYIPVTAPAELFSYDSQSREEFAKTQGFGISTWYGNEVEMGDEATAVEDPNDPIVSAMSESERNAYYEALYGTAEEQEALMETIVDEETGEEYSTMDGFGPGCQGEASEEAYGGDVFTEEFQAEMQSIFAELEQRIQANPDVIAADEEWSGCMAEKGYEYENVEALYDSAYTDFQNRFDAIVPNGGGVDPFEGMSKEEIDAFFAERSQDEIDAFFAAAQTESADAIDQEALEALQKEEIDLAVAEYECSLAFEDVYQEISQAIEADLIAENPELFDRIIEARPD